MIRTSTRRRPQSKPADPQRSGLATVELAVTLPLMLMILLGISEVSRAINVSTKLATVVREGGRTAASDIRAKMPVGSTLNQKIKADMINTLRAGSLKVDQVEIEITHADGSRVGQDFDLQNPDNYLQFFRVTATIPFSEVSAFHPRYFSGKNLSSTIVFRMGPNALTE